MSRVECVAVIALVIFVAGCVQTGFTTFSENFLIDYPSDWNQTSSNVGKFFTALGEYPPSVSVSELNSTIETAADRAALERFYKAFPEIREK